MPPHTIEPIPKASPSTFQVATSPNAGPNAGPSTAMSSTPALTIVAEWR